MELRQATPQPVRAIAGVATMGIVLLAWWFLTWGATAEERIISPAVLPSPMEVVRSFPSLWYERALVQSIAASLRRVLVGFGLAVAVGLAGRLLQRLVDDPHAVVGRDREHVGIAPVGLAVGGDEIALSAESCV